MIFRRLGPYHHCRLKAAGKRMEIVGVELTGQDTVYAWDRIDEANGFQRVNLFPTENIGELAAGAVRARISEALSAARPEVVAIPGWSERGAFPRCSGVWRAERLR